MEFSDQNKNYLSSFFQSISTSNQGTSQGSYTSVRTPSSSFPLPQSSFCAPNTELFGASTNLPADISYQLLDVEDFEENFLDNSVNFDDAHMPQKEDKIDIGDFIAPQKKNQFFYSQKKKHPKFSYRLVKVKDESSLKNRGGISCLTVSSRCFYIACFNGDLLRWYPDENELDNIIFTSKTPGEAREIRKVFVDNKGFHGIVSLANGHNYYISFNSNKAKLLTKLKGYYIECIAWNDNPTESSTQNFIIGTKSGMLLECLIEEKERFLKNLFELPRKAPVVDILLRTFPFSEKESPYYVLLVISTRCMYAFAGSHSFESIFSKYKQKDISLKNKTAEELLADRVFSDKISAKEKCLDPLVLEVPRAFAYSQLFTLTSPQSQLHIFWLTAVGLIITKLNLNGFLENDESIVDLPVSVISYPSALNYLSCSAKNAERGKQKLDSKPQLNAKESLSVLTSPNCCTPLSFSVTENHILFLFEEKIVIISRITKQIIYEQTFPASKFGIIRRFASDFYDGSLWIYSDLNVYEFIIQNENINAWELYLEEGKFEDALKHVHTAEQRDLVLCSHAYFLFENGNPIEAAETFSHCYGVSFEDICLLFLYSCQETALLKFLKCKLLSISEESRNSAQKLCLSSSTDSSLNPYPAVTADCYSSLCIDMQSATISTTPQLVMLFAWICELYLHQLNNLDALLQSEKRFRKHNSTNELKNNDQKTEDKNLEKVKEELKKTKQEFYDLLKQFAYIDEIQPTLYAMFQTYGRSEELLHYATLRKNFDTVVIHHINHNDYTNAINALESMEDSDLRSSLIYRFSHVLFLFDCKRFINLCLSETCIDVLDMSKLVCTLLMATLSNNSNENSNNMNYHKKEAIRLLETLVGKYLQCSNTSMKQHLSDLHSNFLDEIKNNEEANSLFNSCKNDLNLNLSNPNMTAQLIDSDSHIINNTNNGLTNNNIITSSVTGWTRNAGIYNSLIVFYAESDEEDVLLNFLVFLQEEISVEIDIHFALRFCEEHNKQRAMLLLYGLMHMYKEAVTKALERNDLKFAKYNASRSSDFALKKRLWLEIVDHVAREENVKELTQLVKESSGILRIQDIMPFISDNTLIDTFRDDICSSLADYEKKVQDRKQEMEDYQKATAALKEDLKYVNQRYVVISVKQLCEICRDLIFSEKFFAFPCGHIFHASCLKKVKYSSLDKDKQRELKIIQNEFETLVRDNKDAELIEELESELDQILGEECAICGNIMIQAINMPFVDEKNVEEIESWKVETSNATTF